MAEELVTVHVGKNGVTAELIAEIISVLKKRKAVKVKMLKSSLTDSHKDEVAEEIRKACKAKKVKMIGHTMTLEK